MFNYITNFINEIWYPFIIFNWDFILLEFVIIYLFFKVSHESNLYYVLAYFFSLVIFLAIVLSYYQVEAFNAFFLLSELTLIFVLLVFYISLNFNLNFYTKGHLVSNLCYFVFFVVYFAFFFFIENSPIIIFIKNFNIATVWDNWYGIFEIILIIDLYGLFLAYYIITSVEFLIVMSIILLISFIVIEFNITLNSFKNEFFLNFKFFKFFFDNFYNFFFSKKQNLNKQDKKKPNTKSFKKKD